MKNFDIENIERKNIYHTPKNFFPEMQDDVFSKLGLENPAHQLDIKPIAAHQKKNVFTKISYAVAASLVLLFGLIAFNMNSDDELQETQNNIQLVNSSQEIEEVEAPKSEAVQAYEVLKRDVEVVEHQNKSLATIPTKTKEQNTKVVVKPETSTKSNSQLEMEAQMDQVMQELTKTELADLSRGAAQDVYLDLYY